MHNYHRKLCNDKMLLYNDTNSAQDVMCTYFICVSFKVFKLAFQLVDQLQLFLSLLPDLLIMFLLTLSITQTHS